MYTPEELRKRRLELDRGCGYIEYYPKDWVFDQLARIARDGGPPLKYPDTKADFRAEIIKMVKAFDPDCKASADSGDNRLYQLLIAMLSNRGFFAAQPNDCRGILGGA